MLHVIGQHQVADNQERDGMGQHTHEVNGPLAGRFSWHTEIGNRAEKGRKEGNPDQQGIHIPTTGEVLVRRLLPFAEIDSQGDRSSGIQHNHAPVEPV